MKTVSGLFESVQQKCLDSLSEFFNEHGAERSGEIPTIDLMVGFVFKEGESSEDSMSRLMTIRITRDTQLLAIEGDTSIVPFGNNPETVEHRRSNLLHLLDGVNKKGRKPKFWNFNLISLEEEKVEGSCRYKAKFQFGLDFGQ